MSNIKKGYTELHALLLANVDKKVKSIMPMLEALMEAQVRDTASRETPYGLEIFCYYHKQWELITQVEYGSKANSTTGYNTMCKIGTNMWTKQQRDKKNAEAKLLEAVRNNEVTVEQLPAMLDKLEQDRLAIKPLWQTLEELAYEDPRQAVTTS